MNLKQSARMMMLLALFGFAVFWIFVMGLLTVMVGARPTSKPRDDESVKATFTNLDRDKDFNITALVNVTDKDGKVLTNLGERDFDVFENGQLVTQFKQFAPAGQGPVRLGLVMDCTTTMRDKIAHAKIAARALLRMMRDQSDYFGLYFFNDTLKINKTEERIPIAPMNLDRREQAWHEIMHADIRDGTPMLATMIKALAAMEKVTGRRVLVVLTDGMDTGEEAEINNLKLAVLDKANSMGIPLIMVNTSTDFAEIQLMQELAAKSGGQYYPVPKAAELRDIFVKIGEGLQADYTIVYESPNPNEDGSTRNVVVNVRNGPVGKQIEKAYQVPGVIAAGGRRGGSGGTGSLGSVMVVGLCMAGLLLALYAAPNFVRSKTATLVETPTPATAAPALPKSGPPPLPPQAIRSKRPSS